MTFKKSTDKVTFKYFHIVKETEKAVLLCADTNTAYFDGDDFEYDAQIWFPKSQIILDTEASTITLPRWLAEEKDLADCVSDEVGEKVAYEKADKYAETVARAKAAGIKGIRAGMRYATILAKAEAQGIVFAI